MTLRLEPPPSATLLQIEMETLILHIKCSRNSLRQDWKLNLSYKVLALSLSISNKSDSNSKRPTSSDKLSISLSPISKEKALFAVWLSASSYLTSTPRVFFMLMESLTKTLSFLPLKSLSPNTESTNWGLTLWESTVLRLLLLLPSPSPPLLMKPSLLWSAPSIEMKLTSFQFLISFSQLLTAGHALDSLSSTTAFAREPAPMDWCLKMGNVSPSNAQKDIS